ncbi:hypothetical protein ASD48_14075 [Streptomyces sp. Root1310]|nr:hypothetical protein ASD48_14075 [Streptomyces sp. Root1310]
MQIGFQRFADAVLAQRALRAAGLVDLQSEQQLAVMIATKLARRRQDQASTTRAYPGGAQQPSSAGPVRRDPAPLL